MHLHNLQETYRTSGVHGQTGRCSRWAGHRAKVLRAGLEHIVFQAKLVILCITSKQPDVHLCRKSCTKNSRLAGVCVLEAANAQAGPNSMTSQQTRAVSTLHCAQAGKPVNELATKSNMLHREAFGRRPSLVAFH